MKSKVLIVLAFAAAAAVVLSIVLAKHSRTERVMTLKQSQERVEHLKAKQAVPLDPTTRKKIDGLINELARSRDYSAEIHGEKVSVGTRANWELRQIGKPAMAQLIDAAGAHADRRVRQYALGIIYNLSREENSDLLCCLPVFARSMYDEDPKVRGTAVAQIGEMARAFHRTKRQKELERLIPYLKQGLNDKVVDVRIYAGEILWRIGKKNLVPEELVENYKIGTTSR